MLVVAGWAVVFVAGLSGSALASGRALKAAEALGQQIGLSPFVLGLTVVAIGADLPEIANSISACFVGRGDLNVGDSTGSAATQLTLVLGLMCLMRPVHSDRRFVTVAGAWTVGALVVAGLLMLGGQFSRIDGLVMLTAWIGSTVVVGTTTRVHGSNQLTLFRRGVFANLSVALLALGLVALGAVTAVHAFGSVTDELGVPEFVTSFFVLSVGTSLPELMVDGKALREGSGSLALGAIVGSSLVDATMSIGIGPTLFPVEVSADAARGTFVAAAVVATALVILGSRPSHRFGTAAILIALYAALFPLLILV